MHFRFAVLSDPHITLDETLVDYPGRSHLYELSQDALLVVLGQLRTAAIDFLLIPGDLTQNSERVNHDWLRSRLREQSYPTYVIPGNHDARLAESQGDILGLAEFPDFYRDFGYSDGGSLYYDVEVREGVRLLGLNSNQIDADGVTGRIDPEQFVWLESRLAAHPSAIWLTMVHHNLLEHLPGQRTNPLLAGYILQNETLADTLAAAGARLVFTGHLHVQNIARRDQFYEITTGSLVSYPHPYRLVEYQDGILHVRTHRIEQLPGWPGLLAASREHMARGSERYMIRLLTSPPLQFSREEAIRLAPTLRYFWATIAAGDAHFELDALPEAARRFFEQFEDLPPADNDADLPVWASVPEASYAVGENPRDLELDHAS